jgi:RimJ/RimL family protein N-acetyltransferase
MKFTIEPLQEGDYENTLCQWWIDWRWDPPSKEFLPEEGTGGFMVYDDGVPVCAGFMYRTNSKVVWCDWIISNFGYKNRQGRKEAIELLINTIVELAGESGNKFVYALIKNKPLINTYKKLGFTEASSYTTEMIKKI